MRPPRWHIPPTGLGARARNPPPPSSLCSGLLSRSRSTLLYSTRGKGGGATKKMEQVAPIAVEGGGGGNGEWMSSPVWLLATAAFMSPEEKERALRNSTRGAVQEEEEEDLKKRKAAAEVPEKNRPYKRLKKTPPAGWVEKVVRLGGWNPWFVVKKKLSDTDLKTHYSRLPLPASKASDPQRGGAEKLVSTFSDSELEQFRNGEGLPVMLLDRWGREYRGGRLRLWDSKGWIVLKGGGLWPAAAGSMGLRAHDTVEILSFRVGPHKKDAGMLVLVLLPAPDEGRSADVAGGGHLRPDVAH